jgi:hypothetical protein
MEGWRDGGMGRGGEGWRDGGMGMGMGMEGMEGMEGWRVVSVSMKHEAWMAVIARVLVASPFQTASTHRDPTGGAPTS